MSEVGLFTSGKAVSTLDDNLIKRTRYDHKVSLVAFHLLQQEAYSHRVIPMIMYMIIGNTDSFEE